MADLPPVLEGLVQHLVRWPGVGRRSAERIAFFLARSTPAELTNLGRLLTGLPDAIRPCRRCANIAGDELCEICGDEKRDRAIVCVVEQPENLAAIERSGAFRGVYHVLGGAISPLRSIGPDDLRIDLLLERVADEPIEEVVLATNPTVEGEATALYVARRLGGAGVRVTRPATGIPPGGELEYVDRSTLARALERRIDVGG